LYHGAVLIQIAEHPRFTAINSLKIKNKTLRTAYKINDDIGIYLKYAQNPRSSFEEYAFTFHNEHLRELCDNAEVIPDLFLALVCVKDREVCCLFYSELTGLIEQRKSVKQSDEEQYTVLVTMPRKRRLEIYMNKPGMKKKRLPPLKVPWNSFPEKLFD
jgi:hypothetical protein